MALQDGTQLQQIGQMLGGFGAGIQGTLPQYQATQQQIAASKQDQALKMQEERRKAMYSDAAAGLQFAKAGDYDSLIQLGMERLQLLQQLPDANPEDTQRIMQLAIAAKNGSEEAQDLLEKELETVNKVGMAMGYIQSPESKVVSGGDVSDTGQVTVQNPDGTFIAVDVEDFEASAKENGFTNVTRLEDGTWVGMKDNKISPIPADDAAIQPKPADEDSASDPGSATEVERRAAERLLMTDETIAGKGWFNLAMGDEDVALATDVLANEAIALQKIRQAEGITLSFNEALAETFEKMKQKGWITGEEINIQPGESLFADTFTPIPSEAAEGTVAQNADGTTIITKNGMWVAK